MRSLVAAAALVLVSVLILARTVAAEPPPAMQPRPISTIVAALQKKPALKSSLASVRFYAEVFGATELEVPVGSSPETLGPWSDNGALLGAEQSTAANHCGPATEAQRKASAALLAEYGDALPVVLRAWALGQNGKQDQGAELLVGVLDRLSVGPTCPSEHPMYSYRRLGQLGAALECLKAFAPKRDVTKYLKAIKQAEHCASTNTALG